MNIFNAVFKKLPKDFHRRLELLSLNSQSDLKKFFIFKKNIFHWKCSSRQWKVDWHTRRISLNKSLKLSAQWPKRLSKLFLYQKNLSSKWYHGHVESSIENTDFKVFARAPKNFADWSKMVKKVRSQKKVLLKMFILTLRMQFCQPRQKTSTMRPKKPLNVPKRSKTL